MDKLIHFLTTVGLPIAVIIAILLVIMDGCT